MTTLRSEPAAAPAASPATDRRQLTVAVAVLAGVYLVVFGPSVVSAFRTVVGTPVPTPTGGWAGLAALEWDVFSVAVVGVVVLRWLPRHAPDVTRRMGLARRLARPVPGGVPGAATAFVAVVMAATWLGDRVVDGLDLPRGAYPPVGQGAGSLLTGGAASAAAAITEEVVLVALAAAVIAHALDRRRSRWAVPVTIVVLVALRGLPHAYYLGGSVFVLFWVPGAYLLYRWVGSVWPLVVGHAVYDVLVLTGHAYPATAPALDAVLWVLAALGLVGWATSLGGAALSRRRAGRPASASSPGPRRSPSR